ncbi:MAG: hypothetical protein V2I97_11000 [Desulfococcaceae bacterium]|jgi:hypothetical protein|nr:hypothetical protein [Desulfococcaceae bacterium]
MTPFELMNTIDKEIKAYTPKLSAAVNKALLYHGEGSSLILPGSSRGENEDLSFEESEKIGVKKGEPDLIIAKLMDAASLMEQHSSWRLIVDTRKPDKEGNMEFRYTLYREKRKF